MRIAIAYDSVFGNTARIATGIAEALRERNDVRPITVQEARDANLIDIDLLIVGSPTRGFRPTPSISEYVEGLGTIGEGRSAAAFDTRIDLDTIQPPPLRWVVDAGGYAASRIAGSLARHGFANIGGEPGFFVSGTEGPLRDGEIERAARWALGLVPAGTGASARGPT